MTVRFDPPPFVAFPEPGDFVAGDWVDDDDTRRRDEEAEALLRRAFGVAS